MIKFNFLIHKATGTVIKYEEWLEEVQKQPGITNRPVEKEISKGMIFNYKPKEALFSDGFEIIYDSEFTTEELTKLYDYNDELDIELKIKINELIGEREYIKNKHGIEV